MTDAVRVTVTGAAGQIGYSILPLIASGQVFGPDQPLILQLLEIPPVLPALEGTRMELEDCAFPLLHGIVCTSDPDEAFAEADVCFLIGAKPRGPGQERKDLLQANAPIFKEQGAAIARSAKKSVKVLVVGNPANTNCLVAASHASGVDPHQFVAMSRLDQNRAIAQLALRAGCRVTEVERVVIWGNHSSTMVPDPTHARIGGRPALEVVDRSWVETTFRQTIQQRGAAIIKARGKSSALSAARAAVDCMHDWVCGSNGKWVSMAVRSDGHYDLPDGLYVSLPCTCPGDGTYSVVEGLEHDPWVQGLIDVTIAELLQEREAVRELLP